MQSTLLARWDQGYEEVWLIVTDLSPTQATAVWYGMRAWIEGGFKDTKRGGWGWHQTKMVDPERAERLWLAIAVATLWAVTSVPGATLPVNVASAVCAQLIVGTVNAAARVADTVCAISDRYSFFLLP